MKPVKTLAVAVFAAGLFVNLAAGQDGVTRDASGRTPLQVALAAGDSAAVMKLLVTGPAAYEETFTRGKVPYLEPVPADELDTANDLLLALLRKTPDSVQLNFVVGVLSLARNDLARAELSFERVVELEPGNHRAGLELAVVCMLSGRRDTARQHFESVLAEDPPAAVVSKIDRYLTALGTRRPRMQLSVRLEMGHMQDDNINVGPGSDIIAISPIAIGDLEFTELMLSPSSRPVDTRGSFATAAASLIYDAGAPGRWGITSDLNLFENWLESQEHETRVVQGAVGVKHIGVRSAFEASTRAGVVWAGHDLLVSTVGVSPGYLYAFASIPRLRVTSVGLVELRDYDSLDSRDGTYFALEEALQYAFSEELLAWAGCGAAHNSTDDSAFTYSGLSGSAGVSATWRFLDLKTSVRYAHNSYDGKEVLAPEDRVDSRLSFDTGLTLRLHERAGVDLEYHYTDNSSTFDLYDYSRNVTMVSLWGRF